MLQPKKLFPGARIALIGTSGFLPDGRLEPTLAAIRALDLEPVVFDSALARHGYLSGDDTLRARDLNAAFADDSIDGILCMRGGYGAHRLMSSIDFEMIKAHPKLFGGYSDITALNIAFNELCGLMTYHMIMPSTEYYKSVDDYSMNYLKRALFGSLAGPVENPEGKPPMQTLTPGKARGRICGGNLSLVQQSVGTPWAIDTKDKILFLEDVGEQPYRVDAMLTQLNNAGKLRDCAGIVLGYWTDCEPKDPDGWKVDVVFDEIIKPLGIPAVKGLCCGHDLPSSALPLGAMVTLDADACTLVIEEG